MHNCYDHGIYLDIIIATQLSAQSSVENLGLKIPLL